MDRSLAELETALKAAPANARQPVRTFLAWERGMLTNAELRYQFFEHLNSDNVHAVAELLGERLKCFKDLLALGPKLREEWPRVVGTIACVNVQGRDESEQECQERIDRENRELWDRIWGGVEALRGYFRESGKR
jgi:hypothetical protein